MGKIKGQTEFERLQKGGTLTRGQAVKAKCFECNGFEEANHDCGVPNCPLYPYSPYRGKK